MSPCQPNRSGARGPSEEFCSRSKCKELAHLVIAAAKETERRLAHAILVWCSKHVARLVVAGAEEDGSGGEAITRPPHSPGTVCPTRGRDIYHIHICRS